MTPGRVWSSSAGASRGSRRCWHWRSLAGDRVALTLVAPQPDFVYKPLLVEEPFDLGPAERHELGPLAEEKGARVRAVAP